MAKKKAKKKAKKAKRKSVVAFDPQNFTDTILDLDRRVARLEEHCGFKEPQPAQEPQESQDAQPPPPAA